MASDGILEIISNGWVGSDVLCKNGGAGCGGENSCFVLSLAKERESCLWGWSISIDSIPQLLHRTDLQLGYHAIPETAN